MHVEYLEFSKVLDRADWVMEIDKLSFYFKLVVMPMVFLGIYLVLILTDEMTGKPLFMQVLAILLFIGVPALSVRKTLKDGLFVFAANTNGMFYRVYGDPKQAVFLPWHVVNRIYVRPEVSADESRDLVVIDTVPIADSRLPRPAHAYYVEQTGRTRLDNTAKEETEDWGYTWRLCFLSVRPAQQVVDTLKSIGRIDALPPQVHGAFTPD